MCSAIKDVQYKSDTSKYNECPMKMVAAYGRLQRSIDRKLLKEIDSLFTLEKLLLLTFWVRSPIKKYKLTDTCKVSFKILAKHK